MITRSNSSEADSDEDAEFYTLQPAVARFQRKLQKKSNEAEVWDDDGLIRRRGAKKGVRGPRKPVEPSLEIQLLLAKANDAFITKDLEKAEELATRVILMNAETYAAYVLLSSILLERGETELGIIAQMSAAHLRPKDPTVWQHCVDLILEKGRENRASFLKDAIYCYTRMVQINPKDVASRYQKAMLLYELEHKARAAQELELLLKMLPHDPTVLKQLAEVYVDLGEIDKAKQRYRQHMTVSMDPDEPPENKFTWSDVNIYVELFGYEDQYKKGITELKSLARWQLGREAETYWDDVQEDDREWDADDHPRRAEVPSFQSGRFPRGSYGDGLPLELRIKLGIYRLRASKGDLNEAMVRLKS